MSGRSRQTRGVILCAMVSACVWVTRMADAQGHEFLLLDDLRYELRTGARKGGTATSLLMPLVWGDKVMCMTPGPGDGTAYAVLFTKWRNTRIFALVLVGSGVVHTLARYPFDDAPDSYLVDIDMDDAGNLRYLWFRYDYRGGILTAPPAAPALSTLVAWPAGIAPMRFAEEPATGDWWVVDYWGYLLRMGRSGGATSIVKVAGGLGYSGGIEFDRLTGEALVVLSAKVGRVSPSGAVRNGGYVPAGLTDIAFDPVTRGYLVAGTTSQGPSGYNGVYGLLDPSVQVVFHSMDTVDSVFNACDVAYARAFTPLSAPCRGSRYRIAFRSYLEGGRGYQAALAFGCRPGIVTTVGVIPLTPDPLLVASVLGAPFFLGFSGTLDATGAAVLAVDLPALPVLQDVRMHLAAVTYDATGLRGIHGPLSFTVR